MHQNPALKGIKRRDLPPLSDAFPLFCAHISFVENLCHDHKWRVICSPVANLKQKVGENEGKLSQFAKEMKHV